MSELDLDEACLGNNMPKFILHLINRLLNGFNKPSDLKVMIKVRSRLDSIWVLMKDIGAGELWSKKAKGKLAGRWSSIGMINVIECIQLSCLHECESP